MRFLFAFTSRERHHRYHQNGGATADRLSTWQCLPHTTITHTPAHTRTPPQRNAMTRRGVCRESQLQQSNFIWQTSTDNMDNQRGNNKERHQSARAAASSASTKQQQQPSTEDENSSKERHQIHQKNIEQTSKNGKLRAEKKNKSNNVFLCHACHSWCMFWFWLELMFFCDRAFVV